MTLDGNGAEGFDQIGYEELMAAALRAVMREALRKVEKDQALPGAHHFYITYRTNDPGVLMADALRDQYPEEITIVVQHQFWDLEVHKDAFEVVLKFGGVPQHLYVPFAAVTRFTDPSVKVMLPFAQQDANAGALDLEESENLTTEPSEEVAAPADDSDGDTVVSLDAFRRK